MYIECGKVDDDYIHVGMDGNQFIYKEVHFTKKC